MKRNTVAAICLLAFAAGFSIWWIGERRRDARPPDAQAHVQAKSLWNVNEILTLPKDKIKIPFPREIVTEVLAADRFVLSNGMTVRLAGVILEPPDSPWGREALALARRMVERREIFVEYEPEFKKESGEKYAYLYFRIPIINSQPPVGPEFVAWSLNAEFLKLGFAKADTSTFKNSQRFQAYEKEAREETRGMWKKP